MSERAPAVVVATSFPANLLKRKTPAYIIPASRVEDVRSLLATTSAYCVDSEAEEMARDLGLLCVNEQLDNLLGGDTIIMPAGNIYVVILLAPSVERLLAPQQAGTPNPPPIEIVPSPTPVQPPLKLK